MISTPATVSFCSTMLFSNGIFYQKFQSQKQSSAKKRQSLFITSIHLARHNSGLLYSKLIFQKENQQVIIILFIYLISRRASFFLISSIKNKIFLFILNHPFYFYKSLYPLTFLGTKKDHTLQYDPFY